MAAQHFPAQIDSLEPATAFVTAAAEAAAVPVSSLLKLELVLEEIVVNVINHAYAEDIPADQQVFELVTSVDAEQFSCTVRDWGVAFDPLAAEAPDLAAGIEDRPIGGLGLMLVQAMSSSCAYIRVGDANELTFGFSLTEA